MLKLECNFSHGGPVRRFDTLANGSTHGYCQQHSVGQLEKRDDNVAGRA
jgi:hypothetical protein